jgi:hypothetical protein
LLLQPLVALAERLSERKRLARSSTTPVLQFLEAAVVAAAAALTTLAERRLRPPQALVAVAAEEQPAGPQVLLERPVTAAAHLVLLAQPVLLQPLALAAQTEMTAGTAVALAQPVLPEQTGRLGPSQMAQQAERRVMLLTALPT